MTAKKRQPANRIKDFTSIASYKAATAKEGDIDAPYFEDAPIRRIVYRGEPFYSVVDVVAALSETTAKDPSGYWRKLKQRLANVEDFAQVVTKCHDLKLPASDGKLYQTDCADIQTLLRIIQSIPSKKAEPLKQWLAQVGYERIQETAEPSKAIDRAIAAYRKQGRDERWINDRIKAIAGTNEKTDQWKNRGVDGKLYAALNAEMSEVAFGVSPIEHCRIKQLPDGVNRQDHMTRTELAIHNLADTAATDIMIARNTQVYRDTRKASIDGAGVAKVAREALEQQTGLPVVSKHNFLQADATAKITKAENGQKPKRKKKQESSDA